MVNGEVIPSYTGTIQHSLTGERYRSLEFVHFI